jgi:thermitase
LLAADGRVVYARLEDQLESRPNYVDTSGEGLDATVRYLDASVRYLDASVRDLEANVYFLDAAVRYLDASSSYLNAAVRYLDASVRYLDASVRYLDASVFYVDEDGNLLADPYRGQPAAYTARFDPAHDLATGEGVIVAVLDSGIDLTHPLLEDNVIAGYDFVDDDPDPSEELNGLDDDNDGHIDEAAGHGTHVAGIVNLAAPSAQIMPLRIFDTEGHGTYFNAAAAIVYAVDHGAGVINLSGNGDEDSPLLKDAVDYAWQHGVVVVAAAGVDEVHYPGRYANVISVGAVDENDYRAAFARYVGESPTVYAPGTDIFSAYPDGHVATWTGNSMAAPFVAGEVALMLSTGVCDYQCAFNGVTDSGRPVADDATKRIDAFDAVALVTNQPQTRLLVQYRPGVSDGPLDNNIQPYFKIANMGNSVALDELTVRYWFDSQAAGHIFNCDYALVGCSKIAAVFGETAEGDKYTEINFANAGMLYGSIGGQDTGNIQVRINADNWQPFDESQHFSFAANSDYVDWDKVTIYHQGVLVWGVEPGGNTADMTWHNPPDSGPLPSGSPAPVTPTLSLQYYTDGKIPVANYINTHLQLVNGDDTAVPLSDITIRYWFPEAAESFAACDYAVINCANISVVPGPNYFELHFAGNAGLLAPNTNSGNMQLRFHKNNWSNYDQNTHYSYNPIFNTHTNWENIAVYYNGLLIWGIEP